MGKGDRNGLYHQSVKLNLFQNIFSLFLYTWEWTWYAISFIFWSNHYILDVRGIVDYLYAYFNKIYSFLQFITQNEQLTRRVHSYVGPALCKDLSYYITHVCNIAGHYGLEMRGANDKKKILCRLVKSRNLVLFSTFGESQR